jgi:hypothetical protein
MLRKMMIDQWALGLYSALEPHHTSVYVNFLLDEGGDRIRQAYGAAKYERLQAVKRAYDPGNFFRLNQNITPADPAPRGRYPRADTAVVRVIRA